MSVYPRVLAFYTAALAALLIVGTSFLLTPVAASPVPFPLVTYFAREYVANPVQDSHSDSMLIRDFFANSSELTLRRTNDTLVTTRDINTFVGNIGILNNYYMEMADHASKLRSLSAQRPSRGADTSEFSAQSAQETTGFHDSLLGFGDLLKQLAADKGLANYNRDDALETLLKNVVNANKDLLKSIDEDVYAIPGLGPTLGPIVYEIKCILDEILDAVENLTDAVLNDIAPLYRGLIVDATKTACKSGLQLAGLCILL